MCEKLEISFIRHWNVLIESSKTCLFCRRVALSECNNIVPQEDVSQGSGGQVPGLLEDVTSLKSKICFWPCLSLLI